VTVCSISVVKQLYFTVYLFFVHLPFTS